MSPFVANILQGDHYGSEPLFQTICIQMEAFASSIENQACLSGVLPLAPTLAVVDFHYNYSNTSSTCILKLQPY